MNVLALAADDGGCGFYRLRAPSAEVARLGIDIAVADGIDVEASHDPSTGVTTIHEVKTDADLIIVQRPLDPTMTSMIKQAKRQGIATIVEIDDDFETVHPDNMAYPYMNQKTSNWRSVYAACAEADHVTVSTLALSKYAPHGRYTVLRNAVPLSIFDTQPVTTDQPWPRIGWTGTVATHPHDLQVTKGRISRLLKDNGLGFNVIGDGDNVQRNLRLDRSTPVHATGWVELSEFYHTVASTLDIGIVPLEISPFNQAKSALKGLEYAALGIPFVASPTREYELLALDGVGKIANTPGDWDKHIQRMIDRPEETARLGREYRDRIEAEHTYRVRAPEWASAWGRAIDYRKTHRHEEARTTG